MNIKETAQKYSDYIIETRRYLHMHPELSTKEYETSKFVQSELDKIGVPYVQCGLETGVLATIKGGKPGKTILIRGDMDALPVPEENDLPYKSTVDGVMHACGHDTHTAMMLTAAHILNDVKDELCGTVKLAFQPAEETAQGAPSMIANGAMEGVDAVYGQHIWTQVPIGKVAFAAGPRMASAGQFEIWVQGKGGHGAEPHNCHDAVTCCAAIVNSLQTIVSRSVDPNQTAVVSAGCISCGNEKGSSVVQKTATIVGTTRSFEKEVQDIIIQRMQQIVDGTALSNDMQGKLEYTKLYPAMFNSPEHVEKAKALLGEALGQDKVKLMIRRAGGEDFSFMLQAKPGCLFRLGVQDETHNASVHNPEFDFNDKAIATGAACLLTIALNRAAS